MFLPMMGFFMMLLVFGGLGSLVVTADPNAAHKAPVPFAMGFAGLGVYSIFFLALLVEIYMSTSLAGYVGLLLAPTVGSIGGGLLGYRLGLKWSKRAEVVSRDGSIARSSETKL